MSRDIISEFIIGIKNAGNADKLSVAFPYSKLKEAIALVLQKEGFIKSVAKKGEAPKEILEIGIAYRGKHLPKIKAIARVSKLSKRIYLNSSDIASVRSGYGALIMSTPQGVMTGAVAKKKKIGGEALFKIW